MFKELSQYKLIVCDLDNTLIDTERIKELLLDVAESFGYDRKRVWELYKFVRENGGHILFTLENYAVAMATTLPDSGEHISKDIIIQRFRNTLSSHANELFYAEAREFLGKCRETQVPTYLLSLGVESYQQEKVRLSGVAKYFDPEKIIYTNLKDTQKGKSAVLQQIFVEHTIDPSGAGVLFIDDKPDEVNSLLHEYGSMEGVLRYDDRDERYKKTDLPFMQETFGDRLTIHQRGESFFT